MDVTPFRAFWQSPASLGRSSVRILEDELATKTKLGGSAGKLVKETELLCFCPFPTIQRVLRPA